MSWFKRLTGRGSSLRPPTFDLGGWNWRPGDIAQCISEKGRWKDLDSNEPIPGPKPREIVRVQDVSYRADRNWVGLSLKGYGPLRFFGSHAFKKLDERGTGELVERIKKLNPPSRRVKEREDA